MRHIELLSAELEGCRLSPDDPKDLNDPDDPDIREYLGELALFLGVTPVQAMLFTAILTLNFMSRRVTVDQLARYFECRGLKEMGLIADLHELQKRKWIRVDSEIMDLDRVVRMVSGSSYEGIR